MQKNYFFSFPSLSKKNIHQDNLVKQRLDKFLSDSLDPSESLSRTRLVAIIKQGGVHIGGATITNPSYILKNPCDIQLTIPILSDDTPQAQNIALDIIYEDDDLIIINKAAGMVVHPAPGHKDGTIVNALLHHCKGQLSGIGGVRRPGIVHRLDKDTSGLIVVAKNDFAHQFLSRQFSDHSIGRQYKAIIKGTLKTKDNYIENYLGRHPRNRQKIAETSESKGKYAATYYRQEQLLQGDFTLISCQLKTGRTHQIRVHLSSRGHPILGDKLYGRTVSVKKPHTIRDDDLAYIKNFPRQALHACYLGFIHPRTNDYIDFQAKLPYDMMKLLDILSFKGMK